MDGDCVKTEFTRDEILEALTIEPCHITGMHDPKHTLKYICRDQLVVALNRLLDLLEVEVDDLPRRLGDDCYWCMKEEGADRTLLDAWVERRPMTFTTSATGDQEFSDHHDAWEAACDATRGNHPRRFHVDVMTEGLSEPHRISYLS